MVEGLRSRVEAEVMARGGKQRGTEIRFRCPSPGHDDDHPSADYNPGKAVWICRVCGESGNYWHLARLLGLTANGFRPDGWQETRRWDSGSASHVRLEKPGEKKRVVWESDSKLGLGGLHTEDLPLYGAGQLREAHPNTDVLVSEGEKATDPLLVLDFVAVGTVTGAARALGCSRPYINKVLGRNGLTVDDVLKGRR